MKNFYLLRRTVMLCAVMLLHPGTSRADAFDEFYIGLTTYPGVKISNVRYTGDNSALAGGFVWQRGSGDGWTTGQRLTVAKVRPELWDSCCNVYDRLAVSNRVVRYRGKGDTQGIASLDESRNLIRVSEYSAADSTLYLLRAISEGEVSVPIIWKEVDTLDASTRDPLATAGEYELRMLALSRLWAGVKRNFAYLDRAPLDWDSVYTASMELATKELSRDEFAHGLQRIAALLGDGHTFVYGYDAGIESPVVTRLIGDRVYVDRVESSQFDSTGIRRGHELTHVNGIPVMEYGRTAVAPYVSSSTPQWTRHMTYEGRELLRAYPGDTLRLLFSDPAGHPTEVEYVAGTRPTDLKHLDPVMDFTVIDGNIGLLCISDFMASDFRERFDQLYPELLLTSGLVIDVRGNHGGNSTNGDYIMKHLISDSIPGLPWSSPAYVPALASWRLSQPQHKPAVGKLPPFTDRRLYHAPVAVVTDGGTFSAAEDFCALFRGSKRGKIFGTVTGGSTGNGVVIELLRGTAYANICSMHVTMPDGSEFVGIGIYPDCSVEETYESHFLSPRDAAIDAALHYVRSLAGT